MEWGTQAIFEMDVKYLREARMRLRILDDMGLRRFGWSEKMIQMSKTIQMSIFVYTERAGFPRPLEIDCQLDDSTDTIKANIQDREGIPPNRPRIYHCTRFLPNGTRLCDNGVYGGCPLVALCNDWLEIVMIGTSIHVVGTMFQG